jgi:hypothetical protein
MDIKYKRTLNRNKRKVVVYYQGKTFNVGHIKRTIEWEFYPSDIPIGRLTMDRINNELEMRNIKIREQLLSSPLRVTFFQSKINKK